MVCSTRPGPRCVMTGGSVAESGRTVRPMERAVSTASAPARRGSAAVRTAAPGAWTIASSTPLRRQGDAVGQCVEDEPVPPDLLAGRPRAGVGHPEAGVCLGGGVEERQRQLHAPDPVGQGVVHLHDHRSLAALEPLDEGELPQRAGAVEAAHGGQRGQREHLVPAVGGGDLDPAEVPGHVEVRIGGPPWRGQAPGDIDGSLPERGDLAGRPLHPHHQLVPGGGRLEPGDRDHGRTQFGVALMYQVKASFWRMNDDGLIPPAIHRARRRPGAKVTKTMHESVYSF